MLERPPVTRLTTLSIGLVHKVVADGELAAETEQFAQTLAGLPTRAIGLTKRAINASWSADLDTQLDYEAMLQTTAGQPPQSASRRTWPAVQ